MKFYRFYFTDNYGNGDERAATSEEWISDKTDPKKHGFELAKNRVYSKKQSFKMFGTPRRFFDSTFTGFKLLDENFDEARKKWFRERDEQQKRDAEKLKRTVEKMDFDYYQIKGKWNAATVSRRADKLEEAERAADELERGGASNVEIIGVKAGKREKIRGKKKPAKPAKKKTPAKTRAKKKTPAKRAKTSVKTKGKTGDYITDFKTEKKAKAAAENIRALGFETEIVEPRGQLDLFGIDENKKVVIRFSQRELATLINDYYDLIQSGERLGSYKTLLTTFEKATPRERIEFTKKEIKSIIGVLQKYMKKHITEKGDISIYGQTKDLKDTLIKAFYNV